MERLTLLDKTEVLVGAGLPTPLLPPKDGRTKVAVLTQPAATSRAMEVADSIRDGGVGVEVVGLPDRDEAKTLEVAASVYQALAGMRLTVNDTIVGVGGGSVTDLAGFVAGTWLRGVEVVHVPTTFLAAIDASIGGKTGVNISGKNLVGVFWHPSRVVVDISLLSALPQYLVREGMAEAYKTGLIGDSVLADLFDDSGKNAPVEEVVLRSIRVKLGLVERDPLDRAERAFLNFGHTIGHAIEFASPLSHGEGVALGMVAAARLSEKTQGFMGADRVVATLESIGLPIEVGGLDRHRVIDLVARDKKRDAEGVRMVLLRAVGDPVLTHVDSGSIGYALDSIGLRDG